MITVCYSGNRKIFNGLLLSVLSLAKSTEESLRVIVLSMDMPELRPEFVSFTQEQINALTAVLKKYNSDSYAELYDVTPMYRQYLLGGKNDKSGYTPYTNLRLFLDLLENIPDKLIYLDVDTMVTRDIAELYNVDIGECEFGAVLDHMGHFWINSRYCNAGVLLLNLPRIRATGLFDKCRKMVYSRKMIMPDQSAMNKYALKKYYLPRKFNEQRRRTEETVIKHFCKGIRWLPFFHIYNVKQWERERVRKVLKIDWLEETYEEYDNLCKQLNLN